MTSGTHEALIESQFGPRAPSYLSSTVHAGGEDLELMARTVGDRLDARALDVGCGAGHVTFRLAPLVREIVAFDLSSAMLKTVGGEAQRRGLDNVRTVQGVVEDLPFAPETFDIAVSRYSAHHWLSLQSGLAQMRRALKPGALVILSDVVSPGVPLLDTWLQATELFRDPSHVRDRSLPEWLDVLCHEGFAVDQFATFRLRLDFVSWIERMKTSDTSVMAIRALQRSAPSDVNRYFSLEKDGTFTVDTALIVARTRP